MDKQDRQNLLQAAITTAQQLGLAMELVQIEPHNGAARADALIRLRYGDQEVLYAAEVKYGIRPATLGAAIQQLERLGQPALLVTNYVTPPLADALKERGMRFSTPPATPTLSTHPYLYG